MKKIAVPFFLILLFAAGSVFSAAEKKGRPVPPHRFTPDHPMVAALESPSFPPEERERLKKLSKENPAAFTAEMRKFFHSIRQKKAKEMLELRRAYREAASPEQKQVILKKIQDSIRKDMEEHLAIRKKWLENTEKMIRQLEKRLEVMRKRYEKQITEKESIIAKRTDELIGEKPPARLVRDAAGDFRRGRRPAPAKK